MKGIFLLLIIVVIVASGCNKPISKIFDAEVKGTIESSIVETTAAPIPKTLFTGEVITIPFSAEGVKNPISKIELQASFDDGKIYTVVSTATDLSTRAISWTVGTTGGTKSYFRVKFTDSTNAVNYSNTFGPVGVYTRIDTIAGIDGFVQSFNGEGSDIKLTTPYSAVKVGNYLYIAEETDVRRIDLSVSPISSITFAGAPMITGSADGVGEAARFRSIRGITFDGDQYLYVADYTDNCIKRIKLSSQEVETFAGTCSLTGGTTNGVARLSALYNRPTDLKYYLGKLYIVESGNADIRVIDIATGLDSVLAGNPGSSGSTDATGTAARFSGPTGLEIDDVGNLFVADTANSFIRWVNISTGQVKRIGYTTSRHTNLDGENGQVAKPAKILYYNNALFVSDTVTHTLRKIVYDKTNPVGTDSSNYPVFSTVAGYPGSPEEKTGVAGVSRLINPRGLVLHGTKILVLSKEYKTIYSFEPANNTLSEFYSFHHQIATEFSTPVTSKIYIPLGLASDGTNLYVSGNGHVIQKINLSDHKVTLFAGTPHVIGTNDGSVNNAKLNYPTGILQVGDGLFVTDFYSHAIRYIKNGTVVTVAGSVGVPGTTDSASGTVSLLNSPISLCAKDNDLFVADYNGSRIRKLSFTDINNPNINPTVSTLKNGGAVIPFSSPGQIFCKNSGANQGLYVTERTSSIRGISRVDFTGGNTKEYVAGGAGVSGTLDGDKTSATLNSPFGLAVIGDLLYFSEDNYDTIRRVDLSDSNFPLTTISGDSSSSGARDGSLKATRFKAPKSLLAVGNKLYVADSLNNSVRVLDLQSSTTTSIGAGPFDGFSAVNGIKDGAAYPTNYPESFRSLFKSGDYVYTYSYGRLFKINYKTRSSEILGGVLYDRSVVDGPLASSRFGFFQSGALVNGAFYVTDQIANLVRKIDLATFEITTLAGTEGVGGNSSSLLDTPYSIAAKGDYLFIPEINQGYDIRKVNITTGEVSTLTGQYGVTGSTDGNSSLAQFASPYGITAFNNDLYVTEIYENRIRKIDISDINNPITSTVAGSISGIAGALNGVGLNSTFNGPRLLDNDGVDLFIPDGSGATVRRLNPRTSEVTTVIGEEKECVRVDGLLSVARTCQPYWVLRTEDGIFLIDSAGFSIRWVH